MIHGKPVEPIPETPWQRTLREAIVDPGELRAALGLGESPAAGDAGFPVRVPAPFLARMRHGDPDDPLLRQVLPLAAEAAAVPGFCADPVGDLAAASAPGLLRKYRGRALAITTGACAVHCRFCFRRAFPYGEQTAADPGPLLDAVAAMEDVHELILSGGDPLTLSDRRLAEWIEGAAAVARLRVLRLHTRVPVVLPSRVTVALCALLAQCRLAVVVVLHVNHPGELDAEVVAALARLRAAGATLLNQSVLLRGVNDEVDTLAALSTRLFAAGVLPYYLHLLDRTVGTAHFEVDAAAAMLLHEALADRLPGYLVPRLVREVRGATGKRPVYTAQERPRHGAMNDNE